MRIGCHYRSREPGAGGAYATTSLLITTLMCLLVTNCGYRDAEVGKQIIGTWTQQKPVRAVVTYSPDGTFSAREVMAFRYIDYWGTWRIQSGTLVENVTNITGLPPDLIAKVEGVRNISMKIGLLDNNHLVLVSDRQTNNWERQ